MKSRLLHGICALALCVALSLGILPAKAENCFVINVDFLDMNSLRDNDYVAQHLSAGAAGIRLQKYISDSDELAARVRLTILQVATNTLVYDKNYGYQSGTFDSGEIYLPYVDSGTVPYLVTLYIEDWVYAIPFMHLMPRLVRNGACTFGVRIRDLNPALTSDWLMGTMLDLNALRVQGSIVLPICASNVYLIGEATVALNHEQLTVQLALASSANIELHEYAIYCITQVAELTTVDTHRMPQRGYSLGEAIDVYGASSALLYFPMSLSFDSGGLPLFSYDISSADLQSQVLLWNENLAQAPAPAFMDSIATETPTIEIIDEVDPEIVPEVQPVIDPEPEPDLEPEPETAPQPDLETELLPDFESELLPDLESEPLLDLESEPMLDLESESSPTTDDFAVIP